MPANIVVKTRLDVEPHQASLLLNGVAIAVANLHQRPDKDNSWTLSTAHGQHSAGYVSAQAALDTAANMFNISAEVTPP